ncbi:MAG: hypothetical protein HYT87_18140 [Nitrospirae bacterium]|nr:hypothetical protein [Nitrospirota bacterium]
MVGFFGVRNLLFATAVIGASTGCQVQKDTTPPKFTGLATATAISTSEIELSWEPATDDTTPPERIVYDLCQSTAPGKCSEFSDLQTTPPGAFDFTVSGLNQGTRYYLVVRARDEAGNLDDNTVERSARTIPTAVVRSISAGSGTTCALLSDGTVRCWGENRIGQLGNGTRPDGSLTPIEVSSLTGASAVSLGGFHTCALLHKGEIRCWGDNDFGQLGLGAFPLADTPMMVKGVNNVVQIAAGGDHTCALTADGAVSCWGSNVAGELGAGSGKVGPQICMYSDACSLTPVEAKIGSGTVTSVSAGGTHTCAVFADRTVRCWGWNLYGQLGDGTTAERSGAVQVSGVDDAVAVDAGDLHTCALTASGTVKCWGDIPSGRLPPGTAPGKVRTVLDGVQSISGGFTHVCAVLTNRSMKCWGANESGEVGDGSQVFQAAPVPVVLEYPVSTVAVGLAHTCALTQSGQVMCWGNNQVGQLGDGTTINRMTPVPVVDLP